MYLLRKEGTMKRTFMITLLIAGFLGLLCTTSLAISYNPENDLSGWDEYQWKQNNPVAISHTGSAVSFITDGTSDTAWGSINAIFPGSIGITAEVNVFSARGNGQIGIRKYIATTDSGTMLLAQMWLERWDDRYLIYYNLQERDSSGNTIRQLGAGAFGGWGSGTVEWSNGEDVFLGLALVGNEVWFYSPGHAILMKVQLLAPFTPTDDSIQIFGYAQKGFANHIEGTVKNVNIVYP
jgi:hypothetical protein